jgi:hypothetical protein
LTIPALSDSGIGEYSIQDVGGSQAHAGMFGHHLKNRDRIMPIIAYQSFNANASSIHGLASVTDQRFTRDTKKRRVADENEVLQLPIDPENLNTPIEGPANKVPVDGSSERMTTSALVGGQISSVWQNVNREMGHREIGQRMPDIMVCGELDMAHEDFKSIVRGALDIEASPQTKACQCFSRISQNTHAARINRLGFGPGYVGYSVLGLNVVFVHVPNAIATDKEQVKVFYRAIATSLLTDGNVIHLVIGDTNQPSLQFTEAALNDAFTTKSYKNALPDSEVRPADIYQYKAGQKRPREEGTNSAATKMYDVAVYRSDVVKLVGTPVYLSQSSTGQTSTDHCGVVVEIELV